MKKIYTLLLTLLFMIPGAWAQEPIEMADTLRSDGKIYVVICVIMIVLFGIFGYLFYLDRKIKTIQNKMDNK